MAANTAGAYGIYPEGVPLTDVVHSLNQAGFENEDICMLLPPKHPIASMVREANLLSSQKDNTSVTGMIGWLSALGAVLIPTVGFFIRSQAFLHALMTSHEAPVPTQALCGNARTLVELGFSEDDAVKFQDQLRDLAVLVYVSCNEGSKTRSAQEVLRHTGARETATLHDKMNGTMTLSAAASA